ncbi:MAG: NCS2 family permease [Clostridia bacterium]|nr:NCS2 family permease [Clostridia bacterium]
MSKKENEQMVEETTAPAANDAAAAKNPSPFVSKLDKFFGITAAGSTFKTEIIGGLTTFFAMCYILIVNPSQMSGGIQVVWSAVFIATAIGAIIGTLLMALFAKMPFAQAPGMGLNSFFFVSFMLFGFGSAAAFTPEAYSAGMSIILVAGALFMVLSFTGVRKKIAMSMPACLKKAIPAGIGLFIAFIGMQNAGIIETNQYVLVQFVNLNVYTGGATWYSITPAIVALLGLFSIGILSKTPLKKASVILGIVISTALYYLFNIGNPAAFTAFQSIINPADTFVAFGQVGFGAAFKGFQYWTTGAALSIVLLVITFCLVDMFDTFGTLQGTAAEAGMLEEDGNPKNLGKCLMSDSLATVAGGILGTSTVTTFVESSAGVSAGARTGFSSVIVAGMFLIAMFLSPLASIIPTAAAAPALIYVGVLMLKSIKEVDFSDMTAAIPAFLTVIMMPLTYSISNGIGIGMISYIILKACSIRSKADFISFLKNDTVVLVIAILFALRFFLVTM